MTTPQFDPTPSPPTPPASVWEDFIDIFYAPTQVFLRRLDGRFGLALLVNVVLIGGLYYMSTIVFSSVFESEIRRGMEAAMRQNPQMTPEMMAQGEKFAQIFGIIGFVIFWPIIVIVIGMVLWLVGKLFDSTQTFKQGIMVATYSQFPRILGSIVTLVLGLVTDTSSLTRMTQLGLSPARFVDATTTSEYVMVALSRLEPFTIWATVLLAIGLSVTGKIPKDKAAMAAAIVWVLGFIPPLLQAMRTAQ